MNQGYRVKRSESIVLLGNSGISSAPHLHFEVWHGNTLLNPDNYLLTEQISLRVDGLIKGNVMAAETVVICEEGEVGGNSEAKHVMLAG